MWSQGSTYASVNCILERGQLGVIIKVFPFSDSNHFKAQALKNAENAYHIHQARVSLRNELLGPGNTLTAFHLGSLPLRLIIFSIKNIVECVYL